MISRTHRLPEFEIKEYVGFLKELRKHGYQLSHISEMKRCESDLVVFLRHDVDFSLTLSLPMAEAEAVLGVKSTYFLLITGYYNLFHADNRQAIRRLSELGHEVGLHYDLEVFPRDFRLAYDELMKQAAILKRLCGSCIESIAMHQPHRGHGDQFLNCDDFTNPHDPRLQRDLLYVSDSCRAWRDESLLSCISSNPPQRVLFNTHPELYLAENMPDRMRYLHEVLMPRVLRFQRDYFEKEVCQVWQTHPGPRMHDTREIRERYKEHND